jgi:hypothetical protein
MLVCKAVNAIRQQGLGSMLVDTVYVCAALLHCTCCWPMLYMCAALLRCTAQGMLLLRVLLRYSLMSCCGGAVQQRQHICTVLLLLFVFTVEYLICTYHKGLRHHTCMVLLAVSIYTAVY